MMVAILFEDDKPIRAFKDSKCIYNAYKWARKHFCLDDYEPPIPAHKLPEFLEVKFYPFMDEEFFNNLIK